MDNAAGSAGCAVKSRVKRLQKNAAKKHDEDEHGHRTHTSGEREVGATDTEDISEQEVREVEPRWQLTDERDARSEEHDE